MAQFHFAPSEKTKSVALAGSFNDWNPNAMPMTPVENGNEYGITIPLAKGKHLYKFVADGKSWHHDPNNPYKEPDGFGGFNSILWVGMKPDRNYKEPIIKPEGGPSSWTGVSIIPAHEFVFGELAPRDIYIWLPPSYHKEPQRRYPALYMHDGQNIWDDPNCCFGHGGWYVNATAARLMRENKMREVIIIGIPNSAQRLKEYSVGADVYDDAGHPYTQFIIKTLKPYVDAHYRTDAGAAALMGSSCGGVISFFMAYHHPKIFSAAACLSTAFGMDRDATDRDLSNLVRQKGRTPIRLYLDSGTAGKSQDAAPQTRAMAELLRKTGYKDGDDLMHFEDEGAEHNEKAWRARLERPLLFLFGY